LEVCTWLSAFRHTAFVEDHISVLQDALTGAGDHPTSADDQRHARRLLRHVPDVMFEACFPLVRDMVMREGTNRDTLADLRLFPPSRLVRFQAALESLVFEKHHIIGFGAASPATLTLAKLPVGQAIGDHANVPPKHYKTACAFSPGAVRRNAGGRPVAGRRAASSDAVDRGHERIGDEDRVECRFS